MWKRSASHALALGRRPVELAGVRLSPQEQAACTQVTRELRERRVAGLQPFVRPRPKQETRLDFPGFEQRKAWASRHMLLPRMGGSAAHLRYLRKATELPHPLGLRPSTLPPDLQAAVAFVAAKGARVAADRDKRLVAAALRPQPLAAAPRWPSC